MTTLEEAVARAKAAAGQSDTLAETTSNPTAPKAPNHDAPGGGAGVASAAPKLGPEIGDQNRPSPQPNPGAGAPAATTTHMNVTAAQAAAVLEPKKGGKVYHNQHPGSTYITKKGVVLSFDAKGELSVTDPDQQKELDDIADKVGCPIYTKEYHPDPMAKAPTEDIQSRAAQTHADLKAQAARMIR